jgi:hypothetical protein
MFKKINVNKINKVDGSQKSFQTKNNFKTRYKNMTETLVTFDGLEKDCISEGVISPLVS